MKHYIVYNQQGDIVQSMSTPEPISNTLLSPGSSVLEVPKPLLDITIKRVQNGQVVNKEKQIQPNFNYDFNRHLEYPTVREQLGILWHDIDQGLFGDSAKSSSFYKTIQSIKNQYPKS